MRPERSEVVQSIAANVEEDAMKRILLMLVTILSATLLGADEPVRVPKGITYIPTTDAINDAARQLLRERFNAKATDEDVHGMFEDTLFCGPGLWRYLKDDESVSKIKQGRLIMKIPILKPDGGLDHFMSMEGKLFQSAEQVQIFWKGLVKQADFENLTIRKLTPRELRVFWSLISFDITEPIFIMESKKHKFVVLFMSPIPDKPHEKLKIMWIDDFEHLMRKEESNRTADADK